MLSNIKNLVKRNVFRLKNLNKKITLMDGVVVDKLTRFEGYSKVYNNTVLYNTSVGKGTYISFDCRLVDTNIGRFCSIGPKVNTISGHHPTSKFVSTHPAFFSTRKQAGFTFSVIDKFKEQIFLDKDSSKSINIGNDVWIGHGATILEGVTIGDGAIIGSNTFVMKDIEPYSINVGIPSRKIRYRFEQPQIDFLSKVKWWEKDMKWLEENIEQFEDINLFVGSVQLKNNEK